jgi:hypothetical protein
MKFTSSLLTETTKRSNLNTIQTEMDSHPNTLILFTKRNGKIYNMEMPLESKTISDLITDALEQFNATY